MTQPISKRCSNCVMFYPEDGCVDAVSFKMPSGEFRAPSPHDCCGDHETRKPALRIIEGGALIRITSTMSNGINEDQSSIPT